MAPWLHRHAHDQLPWQFVRRVSAGPGRAHCRHMVRSYLTWRTGKKTIWAYLEFGYLVAMRMNVLVPHLPSVFVFRRYVPGVVTAVILNLPVLTFLATTAELSVCRFCRRPPTTFLIVRLGTDRDRSRPICWPYGANQETNTGGGNQKATQSDFQFQDSNTAICRWHWSLFLFGCF